jgi:hypothetical protein
MVVHLSLIRPFETTSVALQSVLEVEHLFTPFPVIVLLSSLLLPLTKSPALEQTSMHKFVLVERVRIPKPLFLANDVYKFLTSSRESNSNPIQG